MTQPPRTSERGSPAGRPEAASPAAAGFNSQAKDTWLIVFAVLTAAAFSTVPTPLYPVYMRHDGFSILTVTIIFAFYSVGAVLSMLAAGRSRDRISRNAILVPALILELVATGVCLTGRDLAALLAARLVTGLGVGMITALAAVRLHERHDTHHRGVTRRRYEMVSTAATIGGLGVGPLIAGVLAQYIKAPLFTPYAVFGGLLVVSIIAVAFTQDSGQGHLAKPALRSQHVGIDPRGSARPIAAVTAGFASFAVFGLLTCITPCFIAGPLRHPSRVLAGVTMFAIFCAAAAAQMATHRLSLAAKRVLGLLGQGLGLAALAVGSQVSSLAVFLSGAVMAGAGAGVLFKAAVGEVAVKVSPANRSEALAGFFLVAYVGLSLPTVGTGLAALAVTATTATTCLASALVLLLAIVAFLAREPVRG